MVEIEQLVDPELEGLLRELGSRPRSVFLRTSRKDALRMLRSRTTEPVGWMAVPDALERELVTVHRAELAEILKQACRTKLLEGEREKLFVMRYRTATERVDPTPITTIRARLARAGGAGVTEPWGGAMGMLRQALSVRDSQGLSVLELAALGQKLVPGDSWRVMSAMAQLANGATGTARELSIAVLNGRPDTEHALRALEVLSITTHLEGNPSRALDTQNHACTFASSYAVGEANRLHYSLLSVNTASALESSARLDDLMGLDHPLIEAANETNRIRWRAGEAAPSPKVQQFVSALRPRLGPVAWRLAHALL